jgi:hypothetical protein
MVLSGLMCVEPLAVVWPHNKWDQYASTQGQQTNLIEPMEAHNTLIIRHGRMGMERRAPSLSTLSGGTSQEILGELLALTAGVWVRPLTAQGIVLEANHT